MRTVKSSCFTSAKNLRSPDFRSARYSAFVLIVPSPCVTVQLSSRRRSSAATSARTRDSFHSFSIARISCSDPAGAPARTVGSASTNAMNVAIEMRFMARLLEDALRHPDVDAVVRFVDQLRDGDVAGDADQLIRLMLAQFARGGDEIDHLLNRHRRRLRQVGIERHADVVGNGLRAGKVQ